VDGAGMPFCFPSAGQDAVRFQACSNFIHAGAFQILSLNAPDDLSLIRISDQMAVSILGVVEEAVMIDLYMSLLVTVLQSKFNILRKALAFLLGKGSHNGQKHLAFRVHCVYGLFFKENRNILLFELPNIL